MSAFIPHTFVVVLHVRGDLQSCWVTEQSDSELNACLREVAKWRASKARQVALLATFACACVKEDELRCTYISEYCVTALAMHRGLARNSQFAACDEGRVAGGDR